MVFAISMGRPFCGRFGLLVIFAAFNVIGLLLAAGSWLISRSMSGILFGLAAGIISLLLVSWVYLREWLDPEGIATVVFAMLLAYEIAVLPLGLAPCSKTVTHTSLAEIRPSWRFSLGSLLRWMAYAALALGVDDAATAAAALNAGEVDWWQDTVDLVQVLAKNKDIKVESVDPLGSIGILRFNHLQVPFNNVKLRQAVLAVVDQNDYAVAIAGDAKNGKPLLERARRPRSSSSNGGGGRAPRRERRLEASP